MKIITFETGTTRRVVLIHWLGIALKFPRIYFIAGFKVIFRLIRLVFLVYILGYKDKKSMLEIKLKYLFIENGGGLYSYLSLKRCWLSGIVANFNEAKFYMFHSNNSFIIPTYFSFFGLINIQPIVRPLENYSLVLVNKFHKLVPRNEVYCHALEDKNFTLKDDGTVALFDYGSPKVFPLIREYGEVFSKILKTT